MSLVDPRARQLRQQTKLLMNSFQTSNKKAHIHAICRKRRCNEFKEKGQDHSTFEVLCYCSTLWWYMLTLIFVSCWQLWRHCSGTTSTWSVYQSQRRCQRFAWRSIWEYKISKKKYETEIEQPNSWVMGCFDVSAIVQVGLQISIWGEIVSALILCIVIAVRYILFVFLSEVFFICSVLLASRSRRYFVGNSKSQ